MTKLIEIVAAQEFSQQWNRDGERAPVDAQALSTAMHIVQDVRTNQESAIRKYAEQFNERNAGEPIRYGIAEMRAAHDRLAESDQQLLERVAERIRSFAQSQLECLQPLDCEVPGGRAGHSIEAIERVGCYAPGGRYPLPSTVLMTTVTAKVAGCREILLASPNPTDMTLAAAYIGGANEMLPIGGAHAIAAMAFGFERFKRCDLICGPGNRWVTAAKQAVVGSVGIDMLAGPSELAIVADDLANAETVAADLLAQAEHDVDARPFLICESTDFAEQVSQQLEKQLEHLPTAIVAKAALKNGTLIVACNQQEAQNICEQLAPEHLELHLKDAETFASQVKHAGCIFVGGKSAEVMGDYGVGPNHTLPTGGTARWTAGLNVFTFIRVRTWLNLEQPPQELIQDTVALAQHEGLEAHARSAQKRLLQ